MGVGIKPGRTGINRPIQSMLIRRGCGDGSRRFDEFRGASLQSISVCHPHDPIPVDNLPFERPEPRRLSGETNSAGNSPDEHADQDIHLSLVIVNRF
jgi:hypothetical protein